jgi:hypothetical protein
MFTGQIDTISNKADWVEPLFVQLIDSSDNSVIDIQNNDIGFDCSVYIKDMDGCVRVTGSIATGEVGVASGDDGPGFFWSFEDTALSGLCAGTYQFGIKTTTNGAISDVIIGTIAVVGGN